MDPTTVALRNECSDLRVQFAADKLRLQEVANAALAESAEQRKELARLRATAAEQGRVGDSGEEPQISPEIVEAMREMERLEFSLLEERRKNTVLMEEKKSIEESASRDVAMLENMLQQTLHENERLADQIAAWEVNKLDNAGQIVAERPPPSSDGSQDPSMRASLSSDTHEPETEPRFDAFA